MSDDGTEERTAGTGRESTPDEEGRTNGGRTSDPELARRAEQAEQSSAAKGLEYDPAAEDG